MDFKNFKPCFLIAMPELDDPNFNKSVILLTDYNESGASGFVINRPTDIKLGASIVLTEGALNPDYANLCLWYGGPVEPQKIWIVYNGAMASHDLSSDLGDDIMIAREIDILTNHEKTIPNNHLRIFHGYAGWGAQQLDSEIAASAWITCPLSQKLIFDTAPHEIWQAAIKNMGFDPAKLMSPKSVFLN